MSTAEPTRAPVPPGLSALAEKRAAFGVDPYYRDAWDDLRALCASAERVGALLWPAVAVLFRPDAVLVRGIAPALAALRRWGLEPLAWRRMRFDRHSIRETWRNQLNIATRDRVDAMDLLLGATDALYVLFRDTAPDEGVPTTTKVSQRKGPADPARRRPEHLRSLVGPAQESVVTYVHIPDEPADLVREMGVYFDRPDRLALVRALLDEGAEQRPPEEAVEELYRDAPAHDLALAPALDRLLGHLGRGAVADPRVGQLRHLLRRARARDGRRWRELLALADALGLPLPSLDRTAIVCALSRTHVEGGVPALPDVDAQLYHPEVR